jgi:hypothetical protein
MRRILIEEDAQRAVRPHPAEKREIFIRHRLHRPTARKVGDMDRPSMLQVSGELLVAEMGAAFGNED